MQCLPVGLSAEEAKEEAVVGEGGRGTGDGQEGSPLKEGAEGGEEGRIGADSGS